MAGDWIKMRVDLPDDPSVVAIAEATGLDEFSVVGRLHKIWSWADKHTTNGNAGGVTYSWIDRYLGSEGFALAMEEAGWLTNDGATVTVPNFDRHNGQSGKQRALTMKRVRNARSVTAALPEKRREEKSISSKEEIGLPPLPDNLDTTEFKAALADWLAYKGRKYKPAALKAMVSRASNLAGVHGVSVVVAAIQRAMANNWQNWDQESSFTQQRAGPETTKPPEYRQVTLEVFNAHKAAGDFLTQPRREQADDRGYYRVYGQLRSKRKIESHTDPNWKPQ